MKFGFAAALLFLKAQAAYAAGGDGYTYYELGGLGPSNWPFLQFEGNQCGGTQGQSGYGQSPVTIEQLTLDHCNTDMRDYSFNAGDCTWNDLDFSISDGGKESTFEPYAMLNHVFAKYHV